MNVVIEQNLLNEHPFKKTYICLFTKLLVLNKRRHRLGGVKGKYDYVPHIAGHHKFGIIKGS